MIDLLTLDDYIDGLGIDPSDEHLDRLYLMFKENFIDNPLMYEGVEILIDTRSSKEDGLEGYPHTFGKLVTRGKKNERCFDRKRANKLHWIPEIINQKDTDDVLCFKFKEGDGLIRDYLWCREMDFLVILQLIRPGYLIVSGFHIDDDKNRLYYQEKYDNREK